METTFTRGLWLVMAALILGLLWKSTSVFKERALLQARNAHLAEVLAEEQYKISLLKEEWEQLQSNRKNALAQGKTTRTPTASIFLSPEEEREVLLSGYVKKKDHVIDLKLPPLDPLESTSSALFGVHPQHPQGGLGEKHKNLWGWSILIYLSFLILIFSVVAKQQNHAIFKKKPS